MGRDLGFLSMQTLAQFHDIALRFRIALFDHADDGRLHIPTRSAGFDFDMTRRPTPSY
jgi:hypothetical protein